MQSLDSLGDLLVGLQVLAASQWRQAREALPAGAELKAILDHLQQQPAWWAASGTAAALNSYQRRCIQRFEAHKDLARLGRTLRWEDYLVLGELGEGGMGIVHKGWDLAEKRLVALKRIKGSSPEMHRRFRREARIQQRLQHPCIARLYRLLRWKGTTLLVLEYIEGRTLTQEIKAGGVMPWRTAARWAIDVLHALDHAHRLKIIHRDVKPSNILLPQQPADVAAKLLDLGLAKCLDPTAMTQSTAAGALTAGDALLGTFEYMAPEQWRGADAIVPASDIYGLGCSLFYALTGGPPFQADSVVGYCNAHTRKPPPRLASVQADVPEALDALVQQMLAKQPAQRGSPAGLIRRLGEVLGVELPAGRTKASSRTRIPVPAAPSAPPAQDSRPQGGTTGLAALMDERFLPFSPEEPVHVAGARTFLRAFFLSGGWIVRLVLLLLLVALGVAGLLWF